MNRKEVFSRYNKAIINLGHHYNHCLELDYIHRGLRTRIIANRESFYIVTSVYSAFTILPRCDCKMHSFIHRIILHRNILLFYGKKREHS